MSSFTDALIRVIAEQPYSGRQSVLAAQAGIERGFFNHILRGVQRPTPYFVGRLCAVLSREQSTVLLAAYLQTVADEVWLKQEEASGSVDSPKGASTSRKQRRIAVHYPDPDR